MSPARPDIPAVLEKLAALGSADQIALHMREQEIKAYPHNPFQCAIAQYVRRETGEPVGVSTDFVQPEEHWFDDAKRYELPAPLIEFVDRYDAELYPELIHPDHVDIRTKLIQALAEPCTCGDKECL